tara:strand:+ start:6537 stop:7346 length:810 start_codon:yes stop_codon:yes gene_type:complete
VIYYTLINIPKSPIITESFLSKAAKKAAKKAKKAAKKAANTVSQETVETANMVSQETVETANTVSQETVDNAIELIEAAEKIETTDPEAADKLRQMAASKVTDENNDDGVDTYSEPRQYLEQWLAMLDGRIFDDKGDGLVADGEYRLRYGLREFDRNLGPEEYVGSEGHPNYMPYPLSLLSQIAKPQGTNEESLLQKLANNPDEDQARTDVRQCLRDLEKKLYAYHYVKYDYPSVEVREEKFGKRSTDYDSPALTYSNVGVIPLLESPP